ncbi:MAG: hypothetical protein PHC45_01735 [Clostridiaceae bacterium]|nr:hypothetical protein [Clostridiaceae bacterium]
MNNTFKIFKYQVYDFTKAVIIFYSIVISISLAITAFVSKGLVNVSFGGMEMVTAIFLFIAGLNCFKSNFKFMLANNVSRRNFYFGNIIALVSISAFMALLDSILNIILDFNIPYEGVVMQLYGSNSFFAGLLWCFGLYTLFLCLGWFITMLYYSCNKLMKTVISIVPVLLIALFQYIDWISRGLVNRAIVGFLDKAMGFAYNNNVYVGALSLFIGAAAIALICFLPLHNAIAKD